MEGGGKERVDNRKRRGVHRAEAQTRGARRGERKASRDNGRNKDERNTRPKPEEGGTRAEDTGKGET